MKKVATVLVVALLVSAGLIACSKSGADAGDGKSDNPDVASPTFSSHARSADMFWRLIEQGIKYRSEGRLSDALMLFRQSYDEYAFGNIEKPIALVHAAETYEMMGEFGSAASLFEQASKIAMHETNREKYRLRAERLRQQAVANAPIRV